jgi:hypothetical protein
LLLGKRVNLNLVEKVDLLILKEWVNNPDFVGEFEPISQETLGELEKQYENLGGEKGPRFFVEKKDGRRLGTLPISNRKDALP